MPVSKALAWLLTGAAVLAAQQGTAGENELLARIKAHMAETLAALPDYTCGQTIERSQRVGTTERFMVLDRVRLEVAVVGRKEIYGWPEAGAFEDKEIQDLVPFGPIGNGNFTLQANAVFRSDAPSYTYAGERTLDGKRAIVFDYRIPQAASGYELRAGQSRAKVGYHGSFWVDKDTLDLIRLELRADDLPPSLQLSEVHNSVDYARVPVGDIAFLLPASAEISLIDLSGYESRNRTKFAACRRFSGQSTVSFGELDTAARTPASKQVTEISLPAGLKVQLELQTTIDSSTSCIGDPVTALVSQPVRKGSQILVPKGAVARGRLRRVVRLPDNSQILVKLDLSDLDFEGKRAPLTGWLVDAGPWVITPDFMNRTRNPLLKAQIVVSEGVISIPERGRLQLGKGFHLTWKTGEPREAAKQ